MPFLSSQSSPFDPNFQNQVRKPDFGRPAPGRLATLEKHQKWPKNAVLGLIPVLMVSYGKNSYKFCLVGVSRRLEAKSINKIFDFRFFQFLPVFSKKNLREGQNALFWAQILVWMDFPYSFSDILMDKNTKRGWWKKCTTNVKKCSDMVS